MVFHFCRKFLHLTTHMEKKVVKICLAQNFDLNCSKEPTEGFFSQFFFPTAIKFFSFLFTELFFWSRKFGRNSVMTSSHFSKKKSCYSSQQNRDWFAEKLQQKNERKKKTVQSLLELQFTNCETGSSIEDCFFVKRIYQDTVIRNAKSTEENYP